MLSEITHGFLPFLNVYPSEAMRLASRVLSGSVVITQQAEPVPPVYVPVPAPEMWEIAETTPGLRGHWCGGEEMQRHWLTRSKQRVCLPCKAAYGIERGCRQVSQAEALRAVDARLENLTPEELAVLKLYGDALTCNVWEDTQREQWERGKREMEIARMRSS